MDGRQIDDLLQLFLFHAGVERVVRMDLHERPMPQRRESGDGCQLSRARVENRPGPDVAECVARDRIGEKGKLGAQAFEGRLAAAGIERSNNLVAASQAFFRRLRAKTCCRCQHAECRNESGRSI
jgi:hypothetical protein